MKTTLLTAGALSFAVAAAALAHGGAKGIQKERMDAMTLMSKSIKQLVPMMQGQITVDPEVVRDAADVIAKHSGESMTKLFPKDSGGMPSVAKPVVWEDWDGFAALAETLRLQAEGLKLAAANPPQGGTMAAGAGMMATTDTAGMMGTTGAAGMMGTESGAGAMGAGMMGTAATETPDPQKLAELPVDVVFGQVSQTCSACHTKYRSESK